MFGYYYPYAMMGMMAPAMMGSMFSANAPAYFKSRYGCDDCFRTEPYPREMPIPYTPRENTPVNPKKNFLVNVFA